MTKLEEVILRDTHANRPSASINGRLYYETDTSTLFRDNGAAWESVEGSGASPLTTAGDLLYHGASVDQRLPIGTTGQVLTVSGGYPTWLNASGIGGGGGGSADAVTTGTTGVIIPGLVASPDIYHAGGATVAYEFDSGSLFTWVNGPVVSEDINSTVKSHYYITTNVNTEQIGYYSFVPGAGVAFDARIKFSHGALTTTNFGSVFLMFLDSTNANRIMTGASPTNTRVDRIYSYKYTGGSYTDMGNAGYTTVGFRNNWYFRLTRDASDVWKAYFSTDGITWSLISSATVSFTVARMGIRLCDDPQEVAIDWMRVT